MLHDARTFERIGKPLPHYTAESLAFSRDGRVLAIGGDQYVRLMDPGTGKQLAETSVAGAAMRLAFTKDASRLVVLVAPGPLNNLGSGDARITIRDAETLEQVGPPIEPEAFVGAYVGFEFASPAFALTEGDRLLLTASEDGELAWWDLQSGAKTRTLPIATGLHAFALSPDGRMAAVGIERGIQLVDVRTGDRGALRAACSRAPEPSPVQPRRGDGRLHARGRDRDALGRPSRRLPGRRFAATGTRPSSPCSAPTGTRSTR